MLTLHLPEDNVLNGGAFGFEGSLICTVLMIVLTILIVWWGGKERGDQSCGTPIMLSWIRLRSVSTFIILTITCW